MKTVLYLFDDSERVLLWCSGWCAGLAFTLLQHSFLPGLVLVGLSVFILRGARKTHDEALRLSVCELCSATRSNEEPEA